MDLRKRKDNVKVKEDEVLATSDSIDFIKRFDLQGKPDWVDFVF